MTVCTVMGENPFSHCSKTPNTTLVPIEMVALGDSCGMLRVFEWLLALASK